MKNVEHKFFLTSDGVKLHYRVSGEGAPLIILPGWTGDTNSFVNNYEELNKHFMVYTLDWRGHGLSETPKYGFRIARLAKDVYDFVEHLGLEKAYFLCHSMGNAVVWCYICLFGQDKISKLILEDEPPCLITNPKWTYEENETYTGGVKGDRDFWQLVNALDHSWDEAWEMFFSYFPPHKECPPLPEREVPVPDPSDPEPVLITTKDNKMHARLLYDHMTNDWRDVIPTIHVPTLIMSGEASHCSTKESWSWLNENIMGSQLAVFKAEELGQHEMHKTNPEKFNKVVIDFLNAPRE